MTQHMSEYDDYRLSAYKDRMWDQRGMKVVDHDDLYSKIGGYIFDNRTLECIGKITQVDTIDITHVRVTLEGGTTMLYNSDDIIFTGVSNTSVLGYQEQQDYKKLLEAEEKQWG